MRRLVPLLLAPLLVLVGALSARAEVSTGEVAVALQRSPVYQEAGVDLIDVPTLVSELTRDAPRVVVAVLATAPTDASAGALATAIGGGLLDTDVVVLVVTADQRYGAATGRAAALRGVDARAALAAERASVADAPFDRDTVTALVASFAQRVAGQAAVDRSVPQPSDGGSFPVLPVVLLVGLAGLGGFALRASRRRRAAATRPGPDAPDGGLPAAFWAPLLVGPVLLEDDGSDCGGDGVDAGGDLGGDFGGGC